MCTIQDHNAMRELEDIWQVLDFVGYQMTRGPMALELRNCRLCHSTLARKVLISILEESDDRGNDVR